MSITITIPAVDRWDGAVSAARTLAPLVTALVLPVLEEVIPGAGVAHASSAAVAEADHRAVASGLGGSGNRCWWLLAGVLFLSWLWMAVMI